MDSIFLLPAEARARFVQTSARTLGCTHICLWSYLPHPSNCLICTHGWLHEDDHAGQIASSSSGSLSRRLFDAYRGSFCSVESGCVPGLAYKEGLPFFELGDSNLINLATTQVQRQFYQEAGVEKAVFMGCKSGEIELGLPVLSNITMQMLQQLYSEEFIQQSQLGELLLPDQSRPSSSSSSLRSLSVGSPEYSSLLLSQATPSFLPAENVKESTPQQATRPVAALVPPHQLALEAYSRYHNTQFPSPASDDMTMTREMLAVISSTSPLVYHAPQQDQALQSRTGSRPLRAFKPYNSALSPKFESKPRLGGHNMIKMGISILRRINLMRAEARLQEPRPTSSNQLHHMISERKRREKLNESFHALRMLLPPGSKKDKASILSNTKDYVNTLKTQISELEERNRMLEMRLPSADETQSVSDSSERVEVQIIRAAESTSEMQQISLRITLREECDMIDLVLRILECLKELGIVSLTSVNASTDSQRINAFALVTLVLQIKASDWDEASFKEAVARAVDGAAVARPATANP